MAKRCVFRRRLKVPSVSDAVTLHGKVFQARGAATKNARCHPQYIPGKFIISLRGKLIQILKPCTNFTIIINFLHFLLKIYKATYSQI